jgi:hypothetical protein
MIPANIKLYFWDTDTEKLNPEDYPEYIISRVLEYGRPDAVRWVFDTFDEKLIRQTLKKNRVMSPKTAEFWRIFFGLRKDEISCLKKHYQKTQNPHWPY